MKEHRSISNDKLVSLEDGLIPDVKTSYVKRMMGTTNSCKQLVQCIKFLLYFELLLFVGWAFYTILETYTAESMEHKITDSIRDSESQNSRSQQLPYEETTITASNFLAEMESLLQTENALEKTLEEQIKKQVDSDETDWAFATTAVEPDLQFVVDEDHNKAEHSPLLVTDVPKLVNVELEKDLETNESGDTNPDSSKSEDTNSDSSKSEETVLVWNFGFLPFPNTYNIKVQSQLSPSDSDKSESTEIAEKLLEMDNHRTTDDDIDERTSALMDQMLLSLILQEALRDAQTMSSSEDDTDPKLQHSTLDEKFYEMNGNGTSLITSSLTDSGSDDWNDSVYGDIIVDRSVRENTNDKTPGDFNEQNQDFTPVLGEDLIEIGPITNLDVIQGVLRSPLNSKQGEVERGGMSLFPDAKSEETSEQNFDTTTISSRISEPVEVYDTPIFIEPSIPWAKSIDKRNIHDVNIRHEPPNMRVENVDGFDEWRCGNFCMSISYSLAAMSSVNLLQQFGSDIITHPPYSPYLALSDYHLFPKLKEHLAGRRFSDDDEVKDEVQCFLNDMAASLYDMDIQKLPQRLQKCINRNGYYVEK